MSRLDLLIFGATGFTGKQAVIHLVRISKKYPELKWAIAGRSKSKLESLIQEVSTKTGENLSSVKLVVAEVTDEPSVKAMCAETKVLVNCCGPYWLYGEPVVKACVENKTHYVDVSGEPQWIETMQLKYDALAREKGVYVVNACGFDSIPNDMGLVFLQQKFQGTVNSAESYLSTHLPAEFSSDATKNGSINYGTWESLVLSLSNWDKLKSLRQQIYPQKLPSFTPKIEKKAVLHKFGEKWAIPFPGADASVVYRTQRYLHEALQQRPVQFKPYVQLNSALLLAPLLLVGLLLLLLTRLRLTRRLLLAHPRLFSLGMVSRAGPSERCMAATQFRFDITGKGWSAKASKVEGAEPDASMTVRVSGTNPGYGATVIALLFSGITILKEQEKMPKTGGVFTTGVAFRDTSLIDRLNENGLVFEVVSSTS